MLIMNILQILYWLFAFALSHTYVFYPILLHLFSLNKKNNSLIFEAENELPNVSVIMSAFNEKHVIREKIESLLTPQYPSEKYQIFVGSDCSNDGTDDIISEFSEQFPYVHFFPFTERRGKPPVINDLVRKACETSGVGKSHILVLTDASVILNENTISELVKHFKNPEIALVDSNLLPVGKKNDGISASETTYLRREVTMKHQEGLIWQQMLGPLGGCFAVRSDFFEPIPPRFLVDDFFVAMRIFEKGGKAISELNAVCFENVSHEIKEEYRRKRRISSGNFQNLRTFGHLLFRFDSLSFIFFSHKVLRWMGPFFIISTLFLSGILGFRQNLFYQILFFLEIVFIFFIPFIDLILSNFKINVPILRGVRYFVWMNFALLEGFFKYVSGIKSNVWQPPKRN